MSLISIKFGGTSMGSAKSITECADIIRLKLDNDSNKVIVTLSAVSNVTNLLIELYQFLQFQDIQKAKEIAQYIEDIHRNILKQIITNTDEQKIKWQKDFAPKIQELNDVIETAKNLSHEENNKQQHYDKLKAHICAFGERFSTHFMIYALDKLGISSERLNAKHIIKTDSSYTKAIVDVDATRIACQKLLTKILNKSIVPIITGFIGADNNFDTTILGRGGSDYTAAIIAGVMKADRLEIWSDVDGIMSADPRIVNSARSWPNINIDIAYELAYNGAKVVHPSAASLALESNIPVYIYNTFNRSFGGTKIFNTADNVVGVVATSNNALAILQDTGIINKIGFIAEIGEIFKKHGISIDVCTTSEITFAASFKAEDISIKFLNDLAASAKLKIEKNITKICIIGDNVLTEKHLLPKLISKCQEEGINTYLINVNNFANNITLMIDDAQKSYALCILHDLVITYMNLT